MRLPTVPLALALGAAAGLLAVAPARAAAPPAEATAALPTYTCARDLPAPPILPRLVIGGDCKASNGAPTSGSTLGTFVFVFTDTKRTWQCQAMNADHYPEQVSGGLCRLDT